MDGSSLSSDPHSSGWIMPYSLRYTVTPTAHNNCGRLVDLLLLLLSHDALGTSVVDGRYSGSTHLLQALGTSVRSMILDNDKGDVQS